MIDYEALSIGLTEQKELAANAINTVGINSYIRNLGFDESGLYRFAEEYVQANFSHVNDDKLKLRFRSAIVRAICLGAVLSRNSIEHSQQRISSEKHSDSDTSSDSDSDSDSD